MEKPKCLMNCWYSSVRSVLVMNVRHRSRISPRLISGLMSNLVGGRGVVKRLRRVVVGGDGEVGEMGGEVCMLAMLS